MEVLPSQNKRRAMRGGHGAADRVPPAGTLTSCNPHSHVEPMSYADLIKQKLTEALSPERLTIEDQSALHAGHNPAAAAGGTHFAVEIGSRGFQRMVRGQ